MSQGSRRTATSICSSVSDAINADSVSDRSVKSATSFLKSALAALQPSTQPQGGNDASDLMAVALPTPTNDRKRLLTGQMTNFPAASRTKRTRRTLG